MTLWTVAHQNPLSMGLPRQEYWGGLLFPPPGDLPDPGMEAASLMSPALAGRSFMIEPFNLYLSINNTCLPTKQDGATGPLSREHYGGGFSQLELT